MEYNPNKFASYEEPENRNNFSGQDPRLLKQYGKFERKYIKCGQNEQHNTLAVFVVASVLETKNKRLLKEAKGLDDVVQVSLSLCQKPSEMINSFLGFMAIYVIFLLRLVSDIGRYCG